MMIEVARASGIFIYSTSGKRYFDMVAGIAVSQIGHQHSRVVESLRTQASRYLHTMVYGEFIQEIQTAFAEKIVSMLPEHLDMVYLVNSGTEANEAALKLAKLITGRHKLVGCRGGYHGSTHGSMSVSDHEWRKSPFRPLLPGIDFLRQNDFDSLKAIDAQTAGVIVETIQGDAGVQIPDKKWVKALRKRCDDSGAKLILDEIQCGVGRTGKFSAFEHYGIVPDILTLGKALGGGMPIGAMVANHELMLRFSNDPILGHITTFGGHPMPCASGLAALSVIEEEGLVEQVEAKGARLAKALDHPAIKAVRRKGLMMAVDFSDANFAQKVLDECLENGVILFRFLSCPWGLRLSPPLTISTEEIEEAATLIVKAIDKVASKND